MTSYHVINFQQGEMMPTKISFSVDQRYITGDEGEPYGIAPEQFLKLMVDTVNDTARYGDEHLWSGKDAQVYGRLSRIGYLVDDEAGGQQEESFIALRVGVVIEGYAAWVDSSVDMICEAAIPIGPNIAEALARVLYRVGVLPLPVSGQPEKEQDMATVTQQDIVENRAQILKEDEKNSKGGNLNARATSRPADPRAIEAMEREADLFPGRSKRATAPTEREGMMDNPNAAGGLGSLQAQQARDERVVAAGGISAAPGPASERQANATAETSSTGGDSQATFTPAEDDGQANDKEDGKAPGETTTSDGGTSTPSK